MAEEPALDRPTVSAFELNEPDRERRVSPSNECDVRGGALPTVNRAVSGDRVGCGWLMPRLGDVGDNDDEDGYQMSAQHYGTISMQNQAHTSLSSGTTIEGLGSSSRRLVVFGVVMNATDKLST